MQHLYFDDNDGRTSLYSPTIIHYNNNINSTAIFRAGISSSKVCQCRITVLWRKYQPRVAQKESASGSRLPRAAQKSESMFLFSISTASSSSE